VPRVAGFQPLAETIMDRSLPEEESVRASESLFRNDKGGRIETRRSWRGGEAASLRRDAKGKQRYRDGCALRAKKKKSERSSETR